MAIRRYAAHAVCCGGTQRYEPGVVELEEGRVVRAYALEGEAPFTVWLGGNIGIVADSHGHQMAIHNGKPLK